MSKYFVPFNQNEPAAVEINGHRLLVISTSEEDLLDNLAALGGDQVREFEVKAEQEEVELAELAMSIRGGVVLTPAGVGLDAMLKSLEAELPWVH